MLSRDEIARAIEVVAHENGALKAILFGSWARGSATERSDVDVIFVEETDLRFLDRLGRYLEPLQDRLRTGVEVLVYTPGELQAISWKPFVRKALEEGIVIHES